MTVPVDHLMRTAIKARQRAQTAIGDAVREARVDGWSWDRISTALGGSPTAEALRRTFAESSGAGELPEGCAGCSGEHGSCACAGGPCT
jgi:hypothetical protein